MLSYEKIMTLSETAKSRVFLATMPEYPVPVIIKELSHASLRVYEQLRGIHSPFFPQIYACETRGELCIIAEEYVEGEPVDVYVRKHSPSDDDLLDLFLQLCRGVSLLHDAEPPIIHRDLKPANLLVDRHGHLHIIDFDASRNYTTDTRKDTRLLGTEGYAAPEQFGYSQTDIRSDVYAIGATMYEVLFDQSFPKGCHILADSSLPERSHNPMLARRLLPVIDRCTRFAPDQRYPNIAGLSAALSRCNKPARSKRYVIAAACLAAALAGAGILFLAPRKTNGIPDRHASTDAEPYAESESAAPSETNTQTTPPAPTEDEDLITAPPEPQTSYFIYWYLQSNPTLTPFYQSLDYENGAAPTEIVLCDTDMNPVTVVPDNCWEYDSGQLLHISDDFLCSLAPDREYILSCNFRTSSHRVHLYPMSTADTVLLSTIPGITPGYAVYSLSHPRPLTFAATHPLGRKILSVRLSDADSPLPENLCAISEDGIRFTLTQEFYSQFPAWSSTLISVHFEDSDIFTANADTSIEITIIE